MSNQLFTHFYYLARRSVLRTLRQPAQIVPALIFPLFLLALNSSGLQSATRLPGFPTDSYFDFALAFAFMQGAMFTAINVGTDLARDVETGFLNRLSLTPLSRPVLLVGQLAGGVVLGIIQAVVYLAVGLIFGATLATGWLGGLVVIGIATLFALGFGAIGAALALKTGSGEAIQGMFPLLFVFFFLSSSNMPRDLITQDWFRTIATYNPASYLIEGVRGLIISGWNANELIKALVIIAVIVVVFVSLSARLLQNRLVRT